VSNHARHAHRKQWWSVAGVVLAVCGIAAIVIGVLSQQSAPQPPASAATPVAVTPQTSASSSSSRTTSSPPPREQAPLSAPGRRTSSTTTPTAGAPRAKDSGAGATERPSGATTRPPKTTKQRRKTTTKQSNTTKKRSAKTGGRPSKTRKAASATSTSSAKPTAQGPILKRSKPTHLSIPAIDVSSNLKQIGLTSNGHIVTPPLVKDSHAYWLTVSPTPGQVGPSVILGHVDSAKWGPAVFFDLGKLRQHDTIDVTRDDGTVAVFKVTHVNSYKKAAFPTDAVYGNTDHAALRLMTCGGTFNSAKRSYESDIVVYAALVDSHAAR
jgi:sortase (surface protein transpeptidase)